MSIFFRSILAALVLLAGFGASVASLAAQSSIKVIVNNDIITSYDIAQRTRMLPIFGKKGGAPAATEELIDETLKFQEGKRLGINIPDASVDDAFAAMGKEKKLSPKQLSQALGKMGLEADTLKRWIKAQLTWRQLLQDRVRREGQVKTEDIMAAMLKEGNPEDITMTEYSLQQIIFVVPDGSSTNYTTQRRREAENFRQRFPGCNDSLAHAKSLNGVVVVNLGRRDSSQLKGPQGEEVQSTGVGQTTRPFATDKGIELIAVCSKRDFHSNSAAISEVETQLKLQQAETLGKDYLKELRDAARIVRK